MNTATITFTPDGTGHAIYTEAIDLGRIGQLTVERATTIEYDNASQCWHAKDNTGFDMYHSPSRQTCLDWERQYLESQEGMKHEQLPDGADPVAAGP